MKKISVCCITYNHEKYLAQAIESVLAQEFAGLIEMVIGEDCSTDSTRAIALEYQERYPKQIRLLAHAENQGMMKNFAATLAACDGDYIALLDGDDYWTDPRKLQKQVGFLDIHPDYVLCFHNVRIGHEGSFETTLYNSAYQADTTKAIDLAIRNYIATVSCVYRRVFTEMPAWFVLAPAGDYSMHMMHARHGKIKYLPDVMAVYREHAQSAWQAKSEFFKQTNWFRMLAYIVPEFTGAVREQLLSSQLAALQLVLAEEAVSETDKGAFLAANVVAIQHLLQAVYPQFEKQRIKANSLEYRLGDTLLKPVRKMTGR